MITINADKLSDGLYYIQDGWIYKYKANGGTVRTYEMGKIVRCKMSAGAKETTNKGEWIIRTDNDPICRPWYNTCKCSKCGQYGTKVWNYCPNCGADMRGEEE